eukprot:CAMPEP_0201559876 /NCGR_PEP_ID=MMETSP0173_2-20130828/76955_1 /ASSEMBLY_ACC=CAM_ASM_000268 /TAXON_ID=218659 /ORGANISM="Vexillifera sp., Strain DIVA3 564/2" /LENGTH=82 /DNA_ID=CAMNT_0047974211 /DNA_START=221 /DNA_END=466 /DNA_ORIENTATION=-
MLMVGDTYGNVSLFVYGDQGGAATTFSSTQIGPSNSIASPAGRAHKATKNLSNDELPKLDDDRSSASRKEDSCPDLNTTLSW